MVTQDRSSGLVVVFSITSGTVRLYGDFFVAAVRDFRRLPLGVRGIGRCPCFQRLLGRSACVAIFFEAEQVALEPSADAVAGADAGLESGDGAALGV